jgi:hypothetical protein
VSDKSEIIIFISLRMVLKYNIYVVTVNVACHLAKLNK